MRRLKTDYQNSELNRSLNERTKYRKTDNGDGTESFEDVSAYIVTGDTFGANDINATNTEVNLLETLDTVTLLASGWSGAIPYTQTVTLERIESTDSPVISMGVPDEQTSRGYNVMSKAYSCIDRVVSNNGSLTFYCYSKKPSANINCLVKGV